MKLTRFGHVILLSLLFSPAYGEKPPRLEVRILMSKSSQAGDASDLLIKILKRQPPNVLYNAIKVVRQDQIQLVRDLINKISVGDPKEDTF